MNKIESWIDTHFNELTSVKTLFVVFLVVLNIILLCGSHHLIIRHDVAVQYIHELEEAIEADGTVIGDVCGGDGYVKWYKGI